MGMLERQVRARVLTAHRQAQAVLDAPGSAEIHVRGALGAVSATAAAAGGATRRVAADYCDASLAAWRLIRATADPEVWEIAGQARSLADETLEDHLWNPYRSALRRRRNAPLLRQVTARMEAQAAGQRSGG